jgi:hypothetical protein
MWHVFWTTENDTGFWDGQLMEREHLEDLRHKWEYNIKIFFM